jgi:hypothetical protein
MRIDELKEEALLLNTQARADLARVLLASLDTLSEAEIEKLWIEEATRRDEELDNGTAMAFPAVDVLSRARARRK